MKEPTELQQKVLDFCTSFEERMRRFPTIREIGDHMGNQNTMCARAHLAALRRKGLIEKVGRYHKVKQRVNHKALLERILAAQSIGETLKTVEEARGMMQ